MRTTAKVTRPDGVVRRIADTGDYKGYLIKITSKGVGTPRTEGGFNSYGEGETWEVYDKYEEFFLPYLNKTKLDAAGLFIEAGKEIKDKDIRDLIGTKWEDYLLKWGTNDGYIIEDYGEIERQERWAKKEVLFRVHPCWETGLTWYELMGRYPPDVFSVMKPFLSYHDEQEEEEGDWKGWCISDYEKLGKALEGIGWKIN